jgi:hypothetical protein
VFTFTLIGANRPNAGSLGAATKPISGLPQNVAKAATKPAAPSSASSSAPTRTTTDAYTLQEDHKLAQVTHDESLAAKLDPWSQAEE